MYKVSCAMFSYLFVFLQITTHTLTHSLLLLLFFSTVVLEEKMFFRMSISCFGEKRKNERVFFQVLFLSLILLRQNEL